MAAKRSLGAPDVLHKLGRPGFPKGMVVMLVGGDDSERREIEEQMRNLCYQVTSCETCSHARQELASRGTACFDIILAEAALVAKDNREGRLLLEAAGSLPLVLVSSPGTTTECVWRGIEVGAADVLEKPLSLLKLQNIWQHVVRKVMDQHPISRTKVPGKEEELYQQIEHSPSRCTLSSSLSVGTNARFPDHSSVAEHEASYCGSQDGKEGSLDVSMSNTSQENSHTVDSQFGVSDITQVHADGKPAKKARRSKDSPANSACAHISKPPLAIRPYASQTLPAVTPSGSPTVVGMVHPSWASSAPGNQAFRGSIPAGCVWGTPLHPPPGWQGMFPNGSGPLLGSAASNCSMARCHSAPVQKLDSYANMVNFDGLPDLDSALMADFTDDLLLTDDFLDCGDNFLDGLGSALDAPEIAEPMLEKPPIGLRLKKSESLVNLINERLGQCQEQQLLPATA